MRRLSTTLITLASCASVSLLVTICLVYYLEQSPQTTQRVLNMRMANVGFIHPMPEETRWAIPDHVEANYPQTIIGYEPQLFLRTRVQGGYDILFYANPGRPNVRYMIETREITSKKPVEYCAEGKLQGVRLLSQQAAHWDRESTRLPRQHATPINSLRGSREAPYVIQINVTEQDTGRLIKTVDYLVIGNQA